ncbi:hypothetical protein GCM10023321_20580 [Pseudonocardia eucalypti]|uniref:Redoxin domain-containing protein n=1 Tax=Pseudonocardia eucalypti TaxID=648755 RepID=A0ABP9PX91_9PSEU
MRAQYRVGDLPGGPVALAEAGDGQLGPRAGRAVQQVGAGQGVYPVDLEQCIGRGQPTRHGPPLAAFIDEHGRVSDITYQWLGPQLGGELSGLADTVARCPMDWCKRGA